MRTTDIPHHLLPIVELNISTEESFTNGVFTEIHPKMGTIRDAVKRAAIVPGLRDPGNDLLKHSFFAINWTYIKAEREGVTSFLQELNEFKTLATTLRNTLLAHLPDQGSHSMNIRLPNRIGEVDEFLTAISDILKLIDHSSRLLTGEGFTVLGCFHGSTWVTIKAKASVAWNFLVGLVDVVFLIQKRRLEQQKLAEELASLKSARQLQEIYTAAISELIEEQTQILINEHSMENTAGENNEARNYLNTAIDRLVGYHNQGMEMHQALYSKRDDKDDKGPARLPSMLGMKKGLKMLPLGERGDSTEEPEVHESED